MIKNHIRLQPQHHDRPHYQWPKLCHGCLKESHLFSSSKSYHRCPYFSEGICKISKRCRIVEVMGLKFLRVLFCRDALIGLKTCNATWLCQGERTGLVAALSSDLNQVVSISLRSSPLFIFLCYYNLSYDKLNWI